jgi:hypothetical protein
MATVCQIRHIVKVTDEPNARKVAENIPDGPHLITEVVKPGERMNRRVVERLDDYPQ